MGLDIGGGGGRCLVVEVETGRVTTAFRSWTNRPAPGVPLGAELDVTHAWAQLGEASREALERAGAEPAQLAGVAATSMRHGSVVLDAEGRELLAAPNADARGLPHSLELAAREGEELHKRTGHWPNPVQPAARLLWMAQRGGEAWKRAAVHLSISDWLAYRLCGALASEPTQASESLLFDLARRDWAWDVIERLELPPRLFPQILDPGTRLGELTATAAANLGVPAGVPVAVGGADTQCGLLGAGVVAAGQLGAILGTTAPVQRVLEQPVLDPEARLWAVPHVVPGLWALESNAGGLGQALDWIAHLLYPDADHPILHLLAEAATSSPGAAGIHSTLGAEVMNARQLSLPTGNLSMSYLTAGDDPARRRHLVRAVLEGMACALRANVEQAEAAAGVGPSPLRVAGGVSRSALFTQLVSDVLGREVEVAATAEASALGAAICAGVGAGIFPDLAAGASQLVRLAREHTPDPAAAARYGEHYEGWNALRLARADSDGAAAAIAMRGLASGASPRAAEESAFRPRILVTADMDESGLEALRRLGDVEHASFRRVMRLLTGESLVEALRGVHVFVTEVDVVDAAALLKSTELRAIAVCRNDAVNVDLDACTALRIPVLNAPGRNADAVADLTVAFMLMLVRKLPEANAFLREPGIEPGDMGRMGQAFGRLQGRELWHKTVGLVGLGAVGRKVVERLRPFGARCLVYDPYLEPDAVRLVGAEPAELDDLLGSSDLVTLHAAVTDASRGLIGAAELARMRPGSLLVNTARAALVDEDALLEALRSGHLAGAALDVFSTEPPGSDHPLLALPNVIATPHIAGNTQDVAAHQGRIIADDLERLRSGETPHHLLNPETLEYVGWGQPRPKPSADLAERLGRGPGPAVTDLQKTARAGSGPRRAKAKADARTSRAKKGSHSVEAIQTMEKILRAFVERIASDEKLRAFARDKDVMLHFRVPDLEQEFHLGFEDGAVEAGIGPPARPAPVQLKLKADLLDGMFTGRRNAMQAAMNGELSFSGDTAKAMTLQEINSDLSRLYREVREQVGDPGDLTALSATGGESAPAGRPVEADDIRHQLVEIVNELFANQLITATGGNVSARIPGVEEAWITPSQLFKGNLSPDILVRMDLDAQALDPDARSPSSEALMHAAVFKARPDAQAVIHAHAPNATILANTGLPFLPISTEAAFFSKIGRIPFIMPGTQELADAVVQAMGEGWAVLMQNHGVLVAGRTLRRTADMVEIIERTCEVIIGCYAVGKEPPTLPEDVVATLARYGDLMA